MLISEDLREKITNIIRAIDLVIVHEAEAHTDLRTGTISSARDEVSVSQYEEALNLYVRRWRDSIKKISKSKLAITPSNVLRNRCELFFKRTLPKLELRFCHGRKVIGHSNIAKSRGRESMKRFRLELHRILLPSHRSSVFACLLRLLPRVMVTNGIPWRDDAV